MSRANPAERLLRWLSRPPVGAHECALYLHGLSDSERLEAWPAAAPTDQLQCALLDAMHGEVEDRGVTLSFSIGWVDADGKVLKTKHHRVEAEQDPDEMRQAPDTPDAQGLVRQAQRHTEAMARLYVNTVSTSMTIVREVMEMQQHQLKLQHEQIVTLSSRAALLDSVDGEETEIALRQESTARAVAWDRFTGVMERLAPDLIQRAVEHVSQASQNGKGTVGAT